ncbi:ZIP family metal transporter [Candidatus Saccharibacteria bacterium]|nr:ZIP family metal transporter [Candidatus Saccharibacteria bacterium]
MTILLAVVSCLAALIGGWVALTQKRNIDLTLALTSGILLGLVAFDLLPELFELADLAAVNTAFPMIAFVVGFLLLHSLEKFILVHHSHEQRYALHRHPHVGVASSFALAGHSFLDGMAIGLAFQINSSVGAAVAIAVIGHRFADGFNTVNLMLYHKNSRLKAIKLLMVVAVAPLLGALSTLFYSLSQSALTIYLGFFAGLLLYIAASDILPQAHSKNPSRLTTALTLAGVILMLLITRLA